ncbi:MAG: 3-dehydroquinate synthase, partial [Oscillospiraceae bacterium]|nr:3-dehydroquinate synthase [Oscillospiraceae bacterium]
DLAGFAAASFLRGIPFVQIPTTLLAQVDSSIGGKTAVNIKAGKNLVGAFHQPSLVICDINTLLTLKPETFCDGMGEVIKYAVAFSKPLFEILEESDIKEVLDDVILNCINCKKEVVQADEKEAGERMKLNFGHTIGHAIEKYYNYKGITHGQAVAVGIYKITKQSEKLGITRPGNIDRIKKLLEKFKLPITASMTDEEILKNSLSDKKRHSDKMTIVVSPEIGDSKLMTLSIDDYKQFLIGKINT